MNKRDLIAPCGLACFLCSLYKDKECKGCMAQKGKCGEVETCATYQCTIEKGLRFCFECAEFPCSKLQPAANGPGNYPHIVKVYNLCRMKLIGVSAWAEKRIAGYPSRVFQRELEGGIGPRSGVEGLRLPRNQGRGKIVEYSKVIKEKIDAGTKDSGRLHDQCRNDH